MISQKWIDQQKSTLKYMVDGDAKVALQEEIKDAEESLNSQRGDLKKHGLRINSYPGNCTLTGERIQGGEGYIRKSATGRWITYSKAGAAEVFGI